MVPVDLPTKLDEKYGIHVDNYSSTKHMGFFFQETVFYKLL